MHLRSFPNKAFAQGIPVFLIDRREKALEKMISDLNNELKYLNKKLDNSPFSKITIPKRSKKRIMAFEQKVSRQVNPHQIHSSTGIWLSDVTCRQVHRNMVSKVWWWLPPVIWPDSEKTLQRLLSEVIKKNGRHFVLNAPWQIALFKTLAGMNVWAGPFCNVTNGLAVQSLDLAGFGGVIVSPELDRKSFMALPEQSPLPLGVILSGNWPLCISRIISDEIRLEKLFISPKNELAWVKEYESNYWIYPSWKLNLTAYKGELQKMGYSLFVHLIEPLPTGVKLKQRQGSWNWDLNLL
jgi:putative protease